MLLGAGIPVRAVVLSGPGKTPSLSTTCPRNLILGWPKKHFYWLKWHQQFQSSEEHQWVVCHALPCFGHIPRHHWSGKQLLVMYTLAQLFGATVFSKLDGNSGFWQISLTEKSRPLTTFITSFGRFQFNKFPFGISSAPEHFQKCMSTILDCSHNFGAQGL